MSSRMLAYKAWIKINSPKISGERLGSEGKRRLLGYVTGNGATKASCLTRKALPLTFYCLEWFYNLHSDSTIISLP